MKDLSAQRYRRGGVSRRLASAEQSLRQPPQPSCIDVGEPGAPECLLEPTQPPQDQSCTRTQSPAAAEHRAQLPRGHNAGHSSETFPPPGEPSDAECALALLMSVDTPIPRSSANRDRRRPRAHVQETPPRWLARPARQGPATGAHSCPRRTPVCPPVERHRQRLIFPCQSRR